MPFPNKKDAGAPPAEKKPRKFTKDGNMIGCERVQGPERMEIDGRQVDVEIQISKRAKTSLSRLAAQVLERPDGVKGIQGGLFRVVAREAAAEPVAAKAGKKKLGSI